MRMNKKNPEKTPTGSSKHSPEPQTPTRRSAPAKPATSATKPVPARGPSISDDEEEDEDEGCCGGSGHEHH